MPPADFRVVFPSCLAILLAAGAQMPARADRAEIGGYFRVMARPDLQGGDGRLGLWNLHGRLLNEGPWLALELKVSLLDKVPGAGRVWADAHFKLEGGSIAGADPLGGSLGAFRASQLYVRAGNVLLRDVTWQLGTLDTWMGDLGLYDLRPAQIFFDTVGLSATWRGERVDLMLGVGDAGFFTRGTQYSPILTAGSLVRVRLSKNLEVGAGVQARHEPRVPGNEFAPHVTPAVNYEDFVRGEVAAQYLLENPGTEASFYQDNPPQARAAFSQRTVFYLGFGHLGPLQWNNLFANFRRRHPENFRDEIVAGREYRIYLTELTDERYEINVGNEALFTLWPDLVDAVWGVRYSRHWNTDNQIAASEEDREYYSTVLRLQLYLTSTVHLLVETSLARERSLNGNLWRLAHDSIFSSAGGQADTRGLEMGDTDRRDTWQLKGGPVFNPTGFGVWARPSLRLLFGLQRASVHAAFGTTLVDSLDDFDRLGVEARSRYTHAIVALEVEAWF